MTKLYRFWAVAKWFKFIARIHNYQCTPGMTIVKALVLGHSNW